MAILRAGPWGNLSKSFQNVPSNTSSDGLTVFPVNCAKANWPNQAWAAYYEVEEGCVTPETITAECASFIGGSQVLDKVDAENYYWQDPGGPYNGQLEIYWSGTAWQYRASFSYGVFESGFGPTDICDPTGTYSTTAGTREVTTP